MISSRQFKRIFLPLVLLGSSSVAIGTVGAQSDPAIEQKATQLAKSIALHVRDAKSVDNIVAAEHELRQLDSLPSSVDGEKFLGHGVMVDYYRDAGVPDLIRYHAQAVVRLSQQLDPATRVQLALVTVLGYEALAELSAEDGRFAEAQAILGAVPSEVAMTPSVTQSLGLARSRYALVGKPAPALLASNWIAATDVAKATLGATNRVARDHAATVIEIANPSCVDCSDGYQYANGLAARFPGQDIDAILVVTMGAPPFEVPGRSNTDRLARLTKYFIKDQHLALPVAVVDSASAITAAYYGDGAQEFVVLDGKGIVRSVLQVWTSQTARYLTAAISDALK